MKHVYLTQKNIEVAIDAHAITRVEAKKLSKKIECQAKIYKVTHK